MIKNCNFNLYQQTVLYLNKLGIDDTKLTPYITHNSKRINSKSKLMYAMVKHLKNRNQMRNVIGDIEVLKDPLFEFNPQKILERYGTQEDLLTSVSEYSINAKRALENNRKLWPLFCEGLLDICEFIESFRNIEEIHELFEFYSNSKSLYIKKSLPLLLSKEIRGYGFALACDFCKEYVSSDYVKPDVHILKVLAHLGLIASDKDELKAFNMLVDLAYRYKVTPYALDKVIWLASSGRLYLSNESVNTNREQYISQLVGNQKIKAA